MSVKSRKPKLTDILSKVEKVRQEARGMLQRIFSNNERDRKNAAVDAASLPWTVQNIEVSDGDIVVKTQDSAGRIRDIILSRERLKLIQYVGGMKDDEKKLYAELRRAPKGEYFAPAHEILYLGKTNSADFDLLKAELEKQGIDWVWYPDHRKENIRDLLPELTA